MHLKWLSKKIEVEDGRTNEQDIANIKKEIQTHMKLKHRNIVKLYNHYYVR